MPRTFFGGNGNIIVNKLQVFDLFIYYITDVNKEGLFRVSGSKKRQEELKDLIDKEENADFDNGRFSPHDVASVLKIFLGELPEPLLTQAPQNAYLQITGKFCFQAQLFCIV